MLEEVRGNVEEIELGRMTTFGIEVFVDFIVANFIFTLPRSSVYVLFCHEIRHFICKQLRCFYISCQVVFLGLVFSTVSANINCSAIYYCIYLYI